MKANNECVRCGEEIYESETLSRCLRCGKATEREVNAKDYYAKKQAHAVSINLPGEEGQEQ